MNNYLKSILLVLGFSVACYALHHLVSLGLGVLSLWDGSGYSLWGLYTFQLVGSLLVALAVLLTNWAMPKSLGFVFLGLVLVKSVAGYIYIQDGLGIFENKFIELNFLAAFFAFLFFDVYMAYRALNQGETKV